MITHSSELNNRSTTEMIEADMHIIVINNISVLLAASIADYSNKSYGLTTNQYLNNTLILASTFEFNPDFTEALPKQANNYWNVNLSTIVGYSGKLLVPKDFNIIREFITKHK